MSKKIIQLNEVNPKTELKELVRSSVEETLNGLLEQEAQQLTQAAKKVEDSVEEILTYADFPFKHWTRIRTNNVIERLNREIRRRTRVVGIFPDGDSTLMLVCARLRYVAGTQWGNKKYMNMKHLESVFDDAFWWVNSAFSLTAKQFAKNT